MSIARPPEEARILEPANLRPLSAASASPGISSGVAAGDTLREAIIRVRNLEVIFDDKVVLDHLDLDVYRGEILGVIGASGSGKSVLTRTIIGLVPKRQGLIEVFGTDVATLSGEARRQMERRWGVMFQHGALFSSLTVAENVQMPMRECLELPGMLLEELAMLKIEMVGLPLDAASKYPAQLSGGMTKRAALARALALDPEIVFLDEPTSGLDPISAGEFDELIITLKASLNLTVLMITHDLNTLHAACDRIAAIASGKVIAAGTVAEILQSSHPWLQSYFHGERGQTIFANRTASTREGG